MASVIISLFTLIRKLPSRYFGKPPPPYETPPDAVVPETMPFLGAGKSGVVNGIDAERVLKRYHDDDGRETEHIVYKRLGSHPSIAKLLEIRTDGSIVLERGTPLRSICRGPSTNEIPIETKIRWLKQAAEGYQYLHSCGIIHGDVGSHNLILTKQDCIKLIDFEGCGVDGGGAMSCYEWFSYRPSMPRVSSDTDVFAFGCMIYELLTGRPPHYEFEGLDNQVEELYEAQQFPDTTDLSLGQLIRNCWNSNASSMADIIRELDAYPA
ncbi:conserved hypothetical protein [Pyrenophora tritici-repentis Pt-1C-BFP]|uniref:Protein tyrosine kinase n=3 Tax=Pyrenophora tritici-repentis TaxID=45151 RepID=A0A316ZTS1_9PLEO|nr:uncharacterized protein PTRG_06660 [Pyrenophora tritici-repentis Pt-1C-BFP]EDU49580.1 conserved hypothetical protein [Pyrenophora tritici-repentis Pt-1C-BFP]KAI1509823.1 Protein tyrosine kinase [Pyrenophora tritici-repentis]KAI1677573.1 Protein tyrosine kinase [Pyrenophora tritici-repentis]